MKNPEASVAEKHTKRILLLPGDGIGPEVVSSAVDVMQAVLPLTNLQLELDEGVLGGLAIDREGTPLPGATLELARKADAILLGAVGGPKWDHLPMHQRPEKGLLGLRSDLDLFANLRPALLLEPLVNASSLKSELVSGLDLLIVRELTGGIYFGEPRGIKIVNKQRIGSNTYIYSESEIERIARVAFELARKRAGRLCSVDKANVLEVTRLWRDVVSEIASDYPDVELSHMYVDNAAMQLVRNPKQFDVIVTGNLFGDILSDVAAMLTGSLGMLPSASLASDARGMYEPVHGSAPDIAGQNLANPLATILSVAMMFRYSFSEAMAASQIEAAVLNVLRQGLRTADIFHPEVSSGPVLNASDEPIRCVGTDEMSQAVLDELKRLPHEAVEQ